MLGARVRPPKPPATVRRIVRMLTKQHPDATIELKYSNPFELLVATILSAQSSDERVNQVTPTLFKRYPDARALAKATPEDLERVIRPTGFFREKARTLTAMARKLMAEHGGEVPDDIEALIQLPGVGRKTANVVLGHAFGVPALAVDRHVMRVSNRIGIARSDDPEIVEQQLCSALPKTMWTLASDVLILHGRRICRPQPFCDRCSVTQDCDYFKTAVSAGPMGKRRAVPTRLT